MAEYTESSGVGCSADPLEMLMMAPLRLPQPTKRSCEPGEEPRAAHGAYRATMPGITAWVIIVAEAMLTYTRSQRVFSGTSSKKAGWS